MKPRNRTASYWGKRSQEQLALIETLSLPHLKLVDKTYRAAQRQILKDVQDLYRVYYTKNGFDVAKLNQIAPRGDVIKFRRSLEAAGLVSRLPDGYAFRLTRLELIEAQMWLEINKTAKLQELVQNKAHLETLTVARQHTLYNLAKGTGISPAFGTVDTKTVDRILKSKFHGKNYSQRIWKNNRALAKDVQKTIAKSVATGESNAKTARVIRDKYKVKRYEAVRLIQTETARFNYEATQDTYQEIDLEKRRYIATLDGRTGDTCADYDNEIYPLGEGPYIPVHPGCRCASAPYIGDGFEPDERIMRDPDTGRNKYIGNISFAEWKKLAL